MTPRTASTVGEWIATVDPRPPEALACRLSDLLAPFASQPVSRVPEACLDAGEGLLNDLLGGGSSSRGTALDLLAVDALVTYAFQAASDEPGNLDARAARAMARIASLPGERPD
ncbi:MAG: hypothetical protein ABIW79_10410 [Gemmatimonas sp.]